MFIYIVKVMPKCIYVCLLWLGGETGGDGDKDTGDVESDTPIG